MEGTGMVLLSILFCIGICVPIYIAGKHDRERLEREERESKERQQKSSQKPAQKPTQKPSVDPEQKQFIIAYMMLFGGDERKALHAYANTDAKLRKIMIKQVFPNWDEKEVK